MSSIEENDNDKVYYKLRKYLDTFPVGFPETKSGVEIRLLKKLFNPEEAKIALKLGIIPQKTEKIFRKFKKKGYTLEQIKAILDGMIEKGLIMGGTGKEGTDMYYSIAFLAIGIFEYQVNKITKDLAELFDEYLHEAFIDEFLEGIPQLRTIPNKESLKTISIDENVETKKIVSQYDDIERLLDGASDTISVAECVCRQASDAREEGCNHPKEVCLQFGGAAHYYISNGWARKITKGEALNILKSAQEEGLVLQPTNTERPTAICCCCGCSCEVLSNARKLEKPAQFFATNFYAQVNPDDCTSCGVCVERCHMYAINLNDDEIAEVDLDRCIGCGVCIPTCPGDAIYLVKKEMEPEIPKDMLDLYKKMGKKKAENMKLLQQQQNQ